MPPIPSEQQSPGPRRRRVTDNQTKQADTSAPPIPSYRGDQHATAAPVPDDQTDTSANAIRGPPRLWDRATTLEFFGGINVSTLYRGMRSKRYPRPIFVSNNAVRWLAHECEAALERMIQQRDGRKRITRRGRPRRLAAETTQKTKRPPRKE